MAGGRRRSGGSPDGILDLHALASARPGDALAKAHAILAAGPAPYEASVAHQAIGVLAPAGADELLGLAHTLAPRGTAGIVASVVPVNDQATAKLMVPLHRYLRDGASLAEALRLARDGAEREPVLAATAWSFLALGAA